MLLSGHHSPASVPLPRQLVATQLNLSASHSKNFGRLYILARFLEGGPSFSSRSYGTAACFLWHW